MLLQSISFSIEEEEWAWTAGRGGIGFLGRVDFLQGIERGDWVVAVGWLAVLYMYGRIRVGRVASMFFPLCFIDLCIFLSRIPHIPSCFLVSLCSPYLSPHDVFPTCFLAVSLFSLWCFLNKLDFFNS
ncbi:hypothetical protein QBC39DRAFT_115632 [Podospora conica]|nr:hypothetical protein QBC39DRAFT_115632 [Schizothecium conicum]